MVTLEMFIVYLTLIFIFGYISKKFDNEVDEKGANDRLKINKEIEKNRLLNYSQRA